MHYFIIRKGKALVDTEEFKSYKRTYGIYWNKIEEKVKVMEHFLEKENVRIANVDGKKLLTFMNKDKMTREDIVSCLENMEDVAN